MARWKQTAIFHPVMRLTTNQQRCHDSHTESHTLSVKCGTQILLPAGATKSNKEWVTRTASCWERPWGPRACALGSTALLLTPASSDQVSQQVSAACEPRRQTEPEGMPFGRQPSVRPGTLFLSHVLYARAQREKLLTPTVCPATCTRLQSWGTELSPLRYLLN